MVSYARFVLLQRPEEIEQNAVEEAKTEEVEEAPVAEAETDGLVKLKMLIGLILVLPQLLKMLLLLTGKH